MTLQPSDIDMEMLDKARKYFVFDENKNSILRDDAPQDVKDFAEKMRKLYSMFD